MAEKEQDHRHHQENRDQVLSIVSRLLFVLMAFALLRLAFHMVKVGQSLIGLATLVTELAVSGGISLWGWRRSDTPHMRHGSSRTVTPIGSQVDTLAQASTRECSLSGARAD